MHKIILFIFSTIFFDLCFAKNPQLYLFLGWDAAKDHIEELNNPEVKGVQIIYSWKKLEPDENKYDFSAIEGDYQVLKGYDKKLFIQLQDRSFDTNNIPVPKYLQSNKYDGGIVEQKYFAREGYPIRVGWVTKQWNPNVKDRFHKLIEQLAKEFDGKIAGVNLPETAIDINQKFFNHKFCNIYVNTIIDNMLFLKQQFKKSKVIQYVNFLTCEWNNDHGYMQKIFTAARKNNIGLGNPNTVPYRKSQMKNSYRFFNKYKSSLNTIAIAVQESDYTYTNPKTLKKFTPEQLYDFDKDYLGADIIFWNIKQPEFEIVLKLFANK
ncbi:hypothetical protein FSC845_05485 [Francisella persica ATCC VR-331]|nr:hypothetical protein FSC845_05485 [Francisella persica ATCC VR-331]